VIITHPAVTFCQKLGNITKKFIVANQNLTDEDLVKLILQGKTECFEVIVDRYERQILAYTARLLNFHQQDAEDVTSETFFRAYRSIASFKSNLKFSSWLYRIAHNTAVNLIKDKSKLFYIDLDDFWFVHSPQKDQKIDTKDLDKILDKLSVTDRSLLVLFHLEEKSLKEIGDIFKLTQNTVAVKLRRARARATKILKNLYD
jgi:RNA polymerase sigma factor (sigma-70 family)